MSTPAVEREPAELYYAAYTGGAPAPGTLAGWLGAALLGAAWQARADSGELGSWAPTLALVGLVGVLVGVWTARRVAPAVRVGPAGVAVEQGQELKALPWYQVHVVRVAGDELVLASKHEELRLPLAIQAAAAERVLSELKERLGSKLTIESSVENSVSVAVKGRRVSAREVSPRRYQQVGTQCVATGKAITLERDVVFCPQCAAPYHRQHVPSECSVCGRAQSCG